MRASMNTRTNTQRPKDKCPGYGLYTVRSVYYNNVLCYYTLWARQCNRLAAAAYPLKNIIIIVFLYDHVRLRRPLHDVGTVLMWVRLQYTTLQYSLFRIWMYIIISILVTLNARIPTSSEREIRVSSTRAGSSLSRFLRYINVRIYAPNEMK